MSYPKQTIELRPTGGIVLDVPPAEVGPNHWTEARNVTFRDAFAERLTGSRDAYVDALATVSPGELYHAVAALLNSAFYWLVFEADGSAWALTGTTAAQIDNALLGPVTGPELISSAQLNGLPVISNSSDEPVYWNGTTLVTLPDWAANESCGYIAASKFHLFALNISGAGGTFPSLVKWSDAAEPGTVPSEWTPSASNQAGSVELADSPGALLCALPLADVLLIYKRRAIYQASYVGGNQVFAFRKVESIRGALNARCVVNLGTQHFVVSDSEMYLFDGNKARPVADSRVKDFFFSALDMNNFQNVFCVYNTAKDEVLIAYPETGNEYPNRALVYDVASDAFGMRDMPASRHGAMGVVADDADSETYDNQTESYDETTATYGDSAPSLGQVRMMLVNATTLRAQDTEAGETINAKVGKHGMHFGEPERVKFLRRVHMRAAKNSGSLLVRVGSQMNPGDAINWSGEVEVDGEQIVNTFAQGRYLSVEVRSTGDKVWKLPALSMEVELRGYF